MSWLRRCSSLFLRACHSNTVAAIDNEVAASVACRSGNTSTCSARDDRPQLPIQGSLQDNVEIIVCRDPAEYLAQTRWVCDQGSDIHRAPWRESRGDVPSRDPPYPIQHPPHGMAAAVAAVQRSEEHTSELPSLMRKSYAVICVTKTVHLLSRVK